MFCLFSSKVVAKKDSPLKGLIFIEQRGVDDWIKGQSFEKAVDRVYQDFKNSSYRTFEVSEKYTKGPFTITANIKDVSEGRGVVVCVAAADIHEVKSLLESHSQDALTKKTIYIIKQDCMKGLSEGDTSIENLIKAECAVSSLVVAGIAPSHG